MRGRRQLDLSHSSGSKKEQNVSRVTNILEILLTFIKKSDQEMTKNDHVYANCCRPEVAGNVISGRNVKTIENYVLVNFEVASSSSFRDRLKNQFPTTICILMVALKFSPSSFYLRRPPKGTAGTHLVHLYSYNGLSRYQPEMPQTKFQRIIHIYAVVLFNVSNNDDCLFAG